MGGAFGVAGNISPDAEFNVFMDPESYRDVLAAVDVTFLPLDVTSTLRVTADHLDRLTEFAEAGALAVGSAMVEAEEEAEEEGAVVARMDAAGLVQFVRGLWAFTVKQTLNFKQSEGQRIMLLHDAAAVGYALYPGLFLLRRAAVAVDCSVSAPAADAGAGAVAPSTRGRTSFDRRLTVSGGTNALVAATADADGVLAAMVEDLQTLAEALAATH